MISCGAVLTMVLDYRRRLSEMSPIRYRRFCVSVAQCNRTMRISVSANHRALKSQCWVNRPIIWITIMQWIGNESSTHAFMYLHLCNHKCFESWNQKQKFKVTIYIINSTKSNVRDLLVDINVNRVNFTMKKMKPKRKYDIIMTTIWTLLYYFLLTGEASYLLRKVNFSGSTIALCFSLPIFTIPIIY